MLKIERGASASTKSKIPRTMLLHRALAQAFGQHGRLRTVGGSAKLQRFAFLDSRRQTLCATPTCSALSSEDKWEITELCHKFDAALNRHNADALSALFAEDAEMVTPKGSFKGKVALAEYFTSIQAMATGNRHLTSNILVEEGTGEGVATASSYRILHKVVSPPMLLATGTIEDEVAKEKGRWKFTRRTFEIDPPLAVN